MFLALKNWRERLMHRGVSGDHWLAGTAGAGAAGSAELLRDFRAAALGADTMWRPACAELGREFANAEALSIEQNLSIMASVERGAARQVRRRRG